MRIYYIFSIKKEIYQVTKNNPENLYKLFESIYYLKKENASIGFKTFNKICNCLEIKNINKRIKESNIDNLSYTLFGNTHIINDYFTDESSKLTVYNSFIKVKSNSMYPIFFKSIENLPFLFVCDFLNNDYFYLKNVTTKLYTR